ncbi:MAG: hypothetical protein RL021_2147 [Bacteroidota bacterium]|jgi:ubiquinone/menaquinone biosynthesis C-methylase UbiE
MSTRTSTGSYRKWDETIRLLQSDAAYQDLLRNTYLDKDLRGNAERYSASAEFIEILKLLLESGFQKGRLLDVGAGNGICSVAFARTGWEVTSLEPDDSPVTGRQAIQSMKDTYRLDGLTIVNGTGESIPFPDASFDVVFVRQAFHHAADLKRFASECLRVLRPGGILLGIREHVILNSKDKARFLEQHPMHKYYGGENAFLLEEYLEAFRTAGGYVRRVLRYFDSAINFFPLTEEEKRSLPATQRQQLEKRLQSMIGPLARAPFMNTLYRLYIRLRTGGPYDERRLPGRMYSFIVFKPEDKRLS